MSDGSAIEIELCDEQIVITPTRPRYDLKDLLHGMTPEAMHEAFDWGPDVGTEAIED